MKTMPTAPTLLDRKAGASSSLQSRDRLVTAIVNKLVRPSDVRGAGSGNRIPSNHELAPLVRDTMKSIDDAENTLDVLPDLNLAAEIQIASILSSKDLITTSLVYSADKADMELDLRSNMIKVVKDYFDDDYKLTDDLYDILYDVLYRTGSYAVSIIPESAVDKAINGTGGKKVSLESLRDTTVSALRPKGILGPFDANTSGSKFGLEALNFDVSRTTSNEEMMITFGDKLAPIFVTDNPDFSKISKIQSSIARARVSEVYSTALESVDSSFNTTTLGKGDQRYYRNPLYQTASISEIEQAEQVGRPSIGRPLVQHYPSESVIPIHTPGDFKMQIGYLILLDNMGNPISRNEMMNSNLAWSWINGSADQKVKRDVAFGLGLRNNDMDTSTNMTVSALTNTFAEFVENKVINAIKNGVYGDSVTMSRPQDVYRIMLARSLAKKSTQLLYVPVEQMTYFALDYNKYGIGRSLLEKTRMLGTVRTALQFATLNGSILNSTRNLEYTIELDPNDREAEKTIDDIRYRVMQSYNSDIPLTGTPDDMWAYMTNAGLSFNVIGNEFYPSTKVSLQDNSPDYKIPDSTTEDDFAKRHYRGLGLDPELIISPDQIEFASQVTSKNLLAARRICKIQERFNPFLRQFVKTYIISDGILLQELANEIREAYPEESKQPGVIGKYLNEFLRNLNVELPSPDTSMLGSQMEQFDQRAEAIDKLLEVYITDETLQETKLDIDTARARGIVKAYLLRQWLRENAVDEDLTGLFDDTERRNEIVTAIASDAVEVSTLSGMLFKRIDSRVETVASNLDLVKEDGFAPDAGGDSFGDDTSGEGDDMFGGDDGTGDDDMFGDDSFGTDDSTDSDGIDDGTDTGDDATTDDDSGDTATSDEVEDTESTETETPTDGTDETTLA